MNYICRMLVLSVLAAALSISVIGCTYHEHYHMGKPQTVTEQ